MKKHGFTSNLHKEMLMARATKLANLKNKMPIGKIKIAKFYVNKANGQISILLPRRKLKSLPVKGEFIYW